MRRWKAIQVLFVIVGAFLLYSTAVSACSCAPPGTPQEELNRSDAVFAGQVESIQDSLTSGFMGPGQDYDVTFDIMRVWKGPETDTLKVKTSSSSASCGYSFQEGEDYLVYANEEYQVEDGDLTVSLCSRTASLENAEQDVAALGAPAYTVDASAPGDANTSAETDTGEQPLLGFGTGLFLALVVPPLFALISLALLVLLVTRRTGRLLAVFGVIGTLGGLIGVYTLISNPSTMVLLTEDPLFSLAMITPLVLGVVGLVRWYTA